MREGVQMTPSEMSLSELRDAVARGVAIPSTMRKVNDYQSIAQEYARRTADCVSVEDVMERIAIAQIMAMQK